MKLGVCLEMFFTDRPFVERIKAAGRCGCEYAEMWFTDATAWDRGMRNEFKDPAAIRAAAQKAGVTITNAVIGSPDGAIGGGLTSPSNRRKWLARAEETLAFCGKAGIGAAIVCTGNKVKGHSYGEMRRSVIAGLAATARLAEKAQVDLFLEVLNDKVDHPGYFLTSSSEGAEICRKIGSPRVKLLFDCYHMQIMEGDLCGAIERNIDVIGHIHSGGHPGRHELWLGETNYPFLARHIEQMGYKGVFAFEYMPTMNHSRSLRKALAHIKEGLKE